MDKPIGRDIFMRKEAQKKIASKRSLTDYRRIESVGELLAKNFINNRAETQTNYWSDLGLKKGTQSQNFKIRSGSISRAITPAITPFTRMTMNDTSVDYTCKPSQNSVCLIEEESISSNESLLDEEDQTTIFDASPKIMSTYQNSSAGNDKKAISVFSRKNIAVSNSYSKLPMIDSKHGESTSVKSPKHDRSFTGFSVKNNMSSNFFHDRAFSFNKPSLFPKKSSNQKFLPATALKISKNFESSKMPTISKDEKFMSDKATMQNMIDRYQKVSFKPFAWKKFK